MIVSPIVKKGFIDHTLYETLSIPRFIETRWGLAALGERDRHANDLSHALAF